MTTECGISQKSYNIYKYIYIYTRTIQIIKKIYRREAQGSQQ
jgi:hypothetical protein